MGRKYFASKEGLERLNILGRNKSEEVWVMACKEMSDMLYGDGICEPFGRGVVALGLEWILRVRMSGMSIGRILGWDRNGWGAGSQLLGEWEREMGLET